MGTITRTDTFADSVAQQSGSASGRSLAHAAAAGRNAAGAGRRRRQRWGPARDALWELLAQHVKDDARVAIVGAGNGDDLALRGLHALPPLFMWNSAPDSGLRLEPSLDR